MKFIVIFFFCVFTAVHGAANARHFEIPAWGAIIYYPSNFRLDTKSNRKIHITYPQSKIQMVLTQEVVEEPIRRGSFLSLFREKTAGYTEFTTKSFLVDNLLVQKFYLEGEPEIFYLWAAVYKDKCIIYAKVELGKGNQKWAEDWTEAILKKIEFKGP